MTKVFRLPPPVTVVPSVNVSVSAVGLHVIVEPEKVTVGLNADVVAARENGTEVT